jgi:hypothetical protein
MHLKVVGWTWRRARGVGVGLEGAKASNSVHRVETSTETSREESKWMHLKVVGWAWRRARGVGVGLEGGKASHSVHRVETSTDTSRDESK